MVQANQFLIMQIGKIVTEEDTVSSIPNDKMLLRVVSVGKANRIALQEFIEWKKALIMSIQQSDKKALLVRLEQTKKLLCTKCRKGLKKYELTTGHGHEIKIFMICEYIIRSLKEDD